MSKKSTAILLLFWAAWIAVSFLIFAAFVPSANAKPAAPPKTVTCKIVTGPSWVGLNRVKDGDTFEGTCADRFGFPEVYRLLDLDTPEKGAQAKCEAERVHAKKASAFAADLAARGGNKAFVVIAKHKEKYGRYLASASFIIDGAIVDWREALISGGFALPYDGGQKADWCALLQPAAPVIVITPTV